MSVYQQPTENLIAFNSSVFKKANSTSLTLSQAQALFLGRTGTPNSTATATTFNGTVTTISPLIIGGLLLSNDGNNNTGFSSTQGASLRSTFMGSQSLAGNDCSAFGFQAIAGGTACLAIGRSATTGAIALNSTNNSTAIGAGASTSASINYQTAIGSNASCSAVQSTAIGYGASATVANQIVLGTANETVICKGTALGISLSATTNLSINGAVFGTGAGGTNSLFSGLLVGTGTGANNTLYGKGSYSSSTDGSSSGNTIIGAGSSNPVYGIMSNHTVIGYNAGGISPSSTQNNITCLGSGSNVIGGVSQSTAIGYGTQSTLANQIVLGTATETVYCVGVPTTGSTPYTSLVLSSGIQLQTAYPAVPSSTMLGYRLSNSASPFAVAGSSIISGTVVNFAPVGGIVLTSGTWSINFTLELLVATAITTATAQTIYVSTASAGAYSTRVPACGSTRIHTTYTYAIGDTPAFSGSFSYYTASGASLYPVFILTFTGGSFSGTGYYTATRIG